jgi:hypothetical protein
MDIDRFADDKVDEPKIADDRSEDGQAALQFEGRQF